MRYVKDSYLTHRAGTPVPMSGSALASSCSAQNSRTDRHNMGFLHCFSKFMSFSTNLVVYHLLETDLNSLFFGINICAELARSLIASTGPFRLMSNGISRKDKARY